MKKELKNIVINYTNKDSNYIDELTSLIETNSKSILKFFNIKKFKNKIEVYLYPTRENLENKYISFGYGKSAPFYLCGFAYKNKEIHTLCLEEYKKVRGHENSNIMDLAHLILHEFVHSCHLQLVIDDKMFGPNKGTYLWLSERLATTLSKQYDDKNLEFKASLEEIISGKCSYNYYHTMFYCVYQKYGRDYILSLINSYNKLIKETPKLYEITNNIYGVTRCKWVDLNNLLYLNYHDKEWGVAVYDDKKLLELLILEMFQAGLSWECILNKREAFREAYDNFNLDKIVNYDDNKIKELLLNKNIIRNKLKIISSINNAKIFKKIILEYGSFSNYIWSFSKNKIIYETNKTKSILSDKVSLDLKKRGMKFVGSTIIYAYLQAIGVINSHEENCYLYRSST